MKTLAQSMEGRGFDDVEKTNNPIVSPRDVDLRVASFITLSCRLIPPIYLFLFSPLLLLGRRERKKERERNQKSIYDARQSKGSRI